MENFKTGDPVTILETGHYGTVITVKENKTKANSYVVCDNECPIFSLSMCVLYAREMVHNPEKKQSDKPYSFRSE